METKPKGGRPPLSSHQGFADALKSVLPRLLARDISWREAERETGVSVRSLRRYAEAIEQRQEESKCSKNYGN